MSEAATQQQKMSGHLDVNIGSSIICQALSCLECIMEISIEWNTIQGLQ